MFRTEPRNLKVEAYEIARNSEEINQQRNQRALIVWVYEREQTRGFGVVD